MRLVLTSHASPWSSKSTGAQRSVHRLACALVERGHDVIVVYTRARNEDVEVEGDPPYAIRWANHLGRRGLVPTLRAIDAVTVGRAVVELVAEGVDAVHSSGEEAALFAALKQRYRFTHVLTPRLETVPPPLLDQEASRWELVRLGLLDPGVLMLGDAIRRADWVCPTSEYAARELETAFGPLGRHLDVIPDGVDRAFLEVERKDEVAGNGPIVCFGPLVRGKGVDTFLEALGRFDAPPMAVQIVGSGHEELNLRRAVDDLGLRELVEFIGPRSAAALADLLAQARLIVLPMKEARHPDAVAEALSVGAPVISTTAGAVPELVDDGRTGLLVEPGDPEALANAMQRLLREPLRAEMMGRAARESMTRNDWNSVAARLEARYDLAPR